MTFDTSDRVDRLQPSGIRRFFEIAAEREDVISLGVGEPDYTTPASARRAAIVSLERGRTDYTANRGMRELRDRIADYVNRYGLTPGPKSVLVTAGASEAVDLAMRALVDPGDAVAVPQPGYVSYEPTVTLASVAVVPGTAFGPGGAGHVRLSYATDRDALRAAFDRLATFLAEHR